LPRVFDIFIQGEQGIDRRHGGLGLGLAIVKALVELHGGTVSAASNGLDRGSTFVVRIPKASEDARIETASDGKTGQARQAKGRILVVDDNVDAAETLTMLLRTAGHDAQYATDARSALALSKTFRAQIAVLDIGLPEMDGYELARRLRSELAVPHLKLIALTGYGSESDVKRAIASGFDAHLVKPAQIEHFLEIIEKFLSSTVPDKA